MSAGDHSMPMPRESSSMEGAPRRRRIVLDTDMGSDVDDAICLALALASPELEVVAVTTVTRDTGTRARIAKKLLTLAGCSEVPVFAGEAMPISKENRFVWFGLEGDGILADDDALPIESERAVDALLRLFSAEATGQSSTRENPPTPPLELVAVGPMTNVARALQRDPSLASRIHCLTIMGGHIRQVYCGKTLLPPGVDYNLCSDPEASRIVLSSGARIRLVTADVTMQTAMWTEDLEVLESSGRPAQLALARAIRRWTPTMREIFESKRGTLDRQNVAFLHDPLSLACVYDESFCSFEDLFIEPTNVDGVFRTLERPPRSPNTWPMRCALEVDAERFRRHLTSRLAKLGAP